MADFTTIAEAQISLEVVSDGDDGPPGEAGYSPEVSTGTDASGNTTLIVTDQSGTTTTPLKDQTARNDAADAAKTATDFIEVDSSSMTPKVGIAGDYTSVDIGDPTNRHVYIDSDSVDIMDGTNTMASFGENIVLGDTSETHMQISSSVVEITGQALDEFSTGTKTRIGSDGLQVLVNDGDDRSGVMIMDGNSRTMLSYPGLSHQARTGSDFRITETCTMADSLMTITSESEMGVSTINLVADNVLINGVPISLGSTPWIELGHKTGTTAFNISTSGYDEIMVFAEISRNSAYHYYSAIMPVVRLRDAMHELKLGGGYSSSTVTTLVQVKVSKTQAQLSTAHINGTSYASATTVYVYGRASGAGIARGGMF